MAHHGLNGIVARQWHATCAPCELSSGCDVLVPKVEFVLPAAKKKSGWRDIDANPLQTGRETAQCSNARDQ
jgi:hypothetical protein